jgi:energy-converting hydrogenase Eha subunit H
MDDSDKESDKKEMDKIARIIKSRLSKRKRVLLSACNLLTVTVVLVDLMFFVELLKIPNLKLLTLVNIGVVLLSYYSYRLRKRMFRKIIEESSTSY